MAAPTVPENLFNIPDYIAIEVVPKGYLVHRRRRRFFPRSTIPDGWERTSRFFADKDEAIAQRSAWREEDDRRIFLGPWRSLTLAEVRKQHHDAARWAARGHDARTIARFCGYSESYVGVLLTDPCFLDLAQHYADGRSAAQPTKTGSMA